MKNFSQGLLHCIRKSVTCIFYVGHSVGKELEIQDNSFEETQIIYIQICILIHTQKYKIMSV